MIRRLLPFTTAAAVIAVLYIAWFFWHRREQEKSFEQEVEYKKTAPDRLTAQVMGSSVKVLNFYVSPSLIHRGGTTLMCYGVVNAKTVKMDPPVDGIWPSVSRCLNVSPKRTTTYTLTASDGAGHSAKETTTVEVR